MNGTANMEAFELFELPAGSSSSAPKHEILRQHMVDALRLGRLKPGQAIPSEQQIAELLDFSRTTVRHTMDSLEREGFIRRVQGKGTFIHDEAKSASANNSMSLASSSPIRWKRPILRCSRDFKRPPVKVTVRSSYAVHKTI